MAVSFTSTPSLAEATANVAAATKTTGTFAVTSGRYYLICIGWTPDTGNITSSATITTNHTGWATPELAVCPGSDGSVYDRTGSARRLDLYVAEATSSTTDDITFTAGTTGGSNLFDDVTILILEIVGAYTGGTAADILVQASRGDTQTNDTKAETSLHGLASANHGTVWVVGNAAGTAAEFVPSADWDGHVEAERGAAFLNLLMAYAVGEVSDASVSWTTSSSHPNIAFEIRSADGAAPSGAIDATTANHDVESSGSTQTISSVAFVSGQPVVIFVESGRTSQPTDPATVAGATNSFTKVAAGTAYATSRQMSAWVCENPTAVTEDVTITWSVGNQNEGKKAVVVHLPGCKTASTILQSKAGTVSSADATPQVGTVTFDTAPTKATLYGFVLDGGIDNPVAGDGLRNIGHYSFSSGNSYGQWASGHNIGVMWSPAAVASPSVELDTVATLTARNGVLLAMEVDTVSAGGGTVTGTAASTLQAFTQDASGTHTAPTFTGTATSSLAQIDQAASGTHTAPVFSGTATSTLSAFSQDAAGTVTDPTVTGTAESTLASFTQNASGTHTAPVVTGSAASTLSPLGQLAAGTFTAPVYTGTATSTLASFTQAGEGTATAPTVTGTITSVLSTFTQRAVTPPVTPTERIVTVAAESRVLLVATETRTLTAV